MDPYDTVSPVSESSPDDCPPALLPHQLLEVGQFSHPLQPLLPEVEPTPQYTPVVPLLSHFYNTQDVQISCELIK